jgi:hypothetical protein
MPFHGPIVRMSIAATSVVGALAGGAIIASPAGAASATPSPSTAPACSTGQLPASILGNPNVKAGQTAGVYIGHGTGTAAELTGYGLAVTHPGTKTEVFTGTITASAPITAVKVRDEKHDVIRLSADHRTLTYLFVNHGGIDGVLFRADCAKTVRFSSGVDGKLLPPTHVFLGAQRVHPTSNPFTVERH